MKTGDEVRDRFDKTCPPLVIVRLTDRPSVSPPGYRVWRVRDPCGDEFDASEYDLTLLRSVP
jgi:hypothetical protein